MTAPITHFLADTLIERRRDLLGPAKILVRKGQLVKADDAVVEEMIVPAHILLDVARGLGVSVPRAMELISCKQGAIVGHGELLAGPFGLTRRTVRAPAEGKIALIDQSKILLQISGVARQAKAGIPGEVVELIAERGVVIQCQGALLQGVWGNGKVGQGSLEVSTDFFDQKIEPAMITEAHRSSIVVAGYCDDPLVFKALQKYSVQGIVLASIHTGLVNQAFQFDAPVLLIEGFGNYRMNSVAKELISGLTGQMAAINAEMTDNITGIRPELVVPRVVTEMKSKPVTHDLFSPGKIVRQFGASGLGKTGELVDFVGEITLQNGSRFEAVKVKFGDGTLNDVPLANLELLE